jgi:hypothetical protein
MTDEPSRGAARDRQHRERIDEIDCKIVELLNERAARVARHPGAQAAGALGTLRPQARGGDLHEPRAVQRGPLYAENLREIYEAILHVMKELRE